MPTLFKLQPMSGGQLSDRGRVATLLRFSAIIKIQTAHLHQETSGMKNLNI